jgi:hypothetical protein
MIYSSFVLCSGHLLGFIQVYVLAFSLFALNIYLKDATSYRFKKGWQEYKEQSYILLPKLFSSGLVNLIFYAVLFTCLGVFLWQ